jgi:hypothetical protein
MYLHFLNYFYFLSIKSFKILMNFDFLYFIKVKYKILFRINNKDQKDSKTECNNYILMIYF